MVLARDDVNGEKRLSAYVVPATVPGPSLLDLRRWLKNRLPEPMIPSWIGSLDALPLSPNGKVDRSALPHITEDAYEPLTEYSPPRNTRGGDPLHDRGRTRGPKPRRHSR